MKEFRDGVIIWTIARGVDDQMVITRADGWIQFDEIKMEWKTKKSINAPVVVEFTIGDKMSIVGNSLIILVPSEVTRPLNQTAFFSDIKMRTGEIISPEIPINIVIEQTVTDIL